MAKKGSKKGQKKSGTKKKARRSAAQKEAALKNLKKARAAQRKAHGGGKKTAKKKSGGKKKAHAGGKKKSGSKKKGGKKKTTHKGVKARSSSKRSGTSHSTKVDVSVRAAAEPKHRASKSKGKGTKGKHFVRGHYALENPIGVVEGIVGAVTLIAGVVVAEGTDRAIVTHQLTDTGSKDANGVALYRDPGDSGKGDGSGHWNSTLVLAPMKLKRWAAGLGLTFAPFVIAAFIKTPTARSALQFFGFGAGARTFGKGLTDFFAWLFRKKSFGQRMFVNELNAQSAMNPNYDTTVPGVAPGPTGLQGAPAAQNGAAAKQGVGACGQCQNCMTGIGACCGRMQRPPTPEPPQQSAPPPPPPPPAPEPLPPTPVQGDGSQPSVIVVPPRHLPMPPVPVPGPRPGPGPGVSAAPAARRSPYRWGHDDGLREMG